MVISNPIEEQVRKIYLRFGQPLGVVRFNWRIDWTLYKHGVEVARGNNSFIQGSQADEFMNEVRKLATKKNLGVVVDKLNLNTMTLSKNYKTGYRRRW